MTRSQAQAALDYWASIMRNRDPLVIRAADAGLTKAEIGKRMGIGHNTVYAILRKHREQAES